MRRANNLDQLDESAVLTLGIAHIFAVHPLDDVYPRCKIHAELLEAPDRPDVLKESLPIHGEGQAVETFLSFDLVAKDYVAVTHKMHVPRKATRDGIKGTIVSGVHKAPRWVNLPGRAALVPSGHVQRGSHSPCQSEFLVCSARWRRQVDDDLFALCYRSQNVPIFPPDDDEGDDSWGVTLAQAREGYKASVIPVRYQNHGDGANRSGLPGFRCGAATTLPHEQDDGTAEAGGLYRLKI
jgi:hypothetical protein